MKVLVYVAAFLPAVGESFLSRVLSMVAWAQELEIQANRAASRD